MPVVDGVAVVAAVGVRVEPRSQTWRNRVTEPPKAAE
jgi:hypothetical protein